MGKIILIFFCSGLAVISAQVENPEDHPCRTPLIEKVKEHGLRSLKVWEVPVFYWDRFQCRKSINNSRYLMNANMEQHEADFEASKSFQGFTSCIAYCSIAAVFVFIVSSSL